jgi:putative ABC transport system substrate-binding protein
MQCWDNSINSSTPMLQSNQQLTMRKRIFIWLLTTLLLATVSPVDAQQPGKIPRIGVLVAGHPPTRPSLEGFRQGLRDLGYVEGKSIILELRWDEGKSDRWAELAGEIVRLKVDVILAGHTAATLGAKHATTTIPIVMGASGGDPVATGLVASLARPGGNITGLAFVGSELSPKRLELIKESIPGLSRAAVIWHPPSGQNQEVQLKEIKATAQSLSLKLQPLPVRQRDDFDSAFRAALREKAGAVLISQSAFFGTYRAHIAELGLKYRLPTISGEADFAESGGLMFYGQNLPDTWKRAAAYVDRILKGTKPADLPVERPKKFELIINLKTAKQIGLTIAPNVLARADKVIT